MTRPLLILRPEPGNARTCDAAAALGLSAISLPLFEIAAKYWAPVSPTDFGGLLLTSANAIRFGGPNLQALINLPVYAVGAATAEVARKAGFEIAMTGTSGAQALLDGIPAMKKPLLHLCAPDYTATRGETIFVYATIPIDPLGLHDALAQRPIALLHSTRAAQHFAQLATSGDRIALACLSPAIAAAAGGGWESVAIAANPRDEDLLALASHLAGSGTDND